VVVGLVGGQVVAAQQRPLHLAPVHPLALPPQQHGRVQLLVSGLLGSVLVGEACGPGVAVLEGPQHLAPVHPLALPPQQQEHVQLLVSGVLGPVALFWQYGGAGAP
jgi:hypothetical protein